MSGGEPLPVVHTYWLPVVPAPPEMGATEPPIHAPAAIAGTPLAEQILKRRPQVGRERNDPKLDGPKVFCHAAPVQFTDPGLGVRRYLPAAMISRFLAKARGIWNAQLF